MEQYHFLGYEQPIGEHLKYLVKSGGQPPNLGPSPPGSKEILTYAALPEGHEL
jgi:hypothetical protein